MEFNIDIDNTVNNFIHKFVEFYSALSGKNVAVNDIKHYDLTSLGVDRHTLETLFFKNNAFFETLSPMQNAVETVDDLVNAGHNVRFVTAIDYDVINARLDFVKKYFPMVDISKSLLVTNNKYSIHADFVIDDLPTNLSNVNRDCQFILMKQPWNLDHYELLKSSRHCWTKSYCCEDWKEVNSLFKTLGLI